MQAISTASQSSASVATGNISRGSSVSSDFINEYEEILKYAFVAPKVGIEENLYKEKDTSVKTSIIQNGNSSNSSIVTTSELKENKVTSSVIDSNFVNVPETKIPVLYPTRKSNNKEITFNLSSAIAMDTLLGFTDTLHKEENQNTQGKDNNGSFISTPETITSTSQSNMDKDLIRMDSLLEDWLLQLKRNILTEMADMKMKQFQSEESSIHQMKARHNAETLKLTCKVEKFKELIYTFEQNVKQKDEVISSMTEALKKQREKSNKIRLFNMWRLKHNEEQQHQFFIRVAEKHYNKALCSKVWLAWRSFIGNKWKERVERACQIKSQEVCLKLTQDYEERLQALQRELASTRGEVANLHRERDFYEEKMKKAFMRGVCALNIEAMSMFKEGKLTEADEILYSTRSHQCCFSQDKASTTTENGHAENVISCHTHDLQPRDPLMKKHVKFDSPKFQSFDSKSKTCRKGKSSRDLNVKISGKNGLTTSRLLGSKRQSAVSSVRVEKHATKKEMIIASDSEQGKSQCMYIESVMQTLPAGGKVVD